MSGFFMSAFFLRNKNVIHTWYFIAPIKIVVRQIRDDSAQSIRVHFKKR